MIRYYVDVPVELHARATHALRLLLEGQGIVAAPASTAATADLVYGPASNGTSGLHIAADTAHWDNRDRNLLATELVDPIAAAYFLAAGVWESSRIKNEFGVPSLSRNGAGAQRLVQKPVVARVSELLRRQIQSSEESRNRQLEIVPRWPGGCVFAISLTHDVDRPFSRPTGEHYSARIRRYLAESDYAAAGRGVAGYIRNVIIAGDSGKRPEADPQFGFDTWMKAEEDLGIRSAFYIAVRGSAEPGTNRRDVYYNAAHPAIVAAIRNAVERGFEVGLHASITCRDTPGFLAEERDRLSALLGGQRVRGVRHHYLALDSANPELTLAQHEHVGFDYDSSLGLNDAAGFRRGMAWPFRPFDRIRDVELGITEVPLTAMDMGIFRPDISPTQAIADLEAHIDVVQAAGGCAVINWHLAQANPQRLYGAGPSLLDVLARRMQSRAGEIWWATPSEIVDWWHIRRRQIFPEGEHVAVS
jgi:hypothetical protein